VPPAVFYPLTVAAVDPLTDDAAAITFHVPTPHRDAFAFKPGQSLTVRRGAERRSYSICVPPGRAPRIGVREVPGGAVSGWLVRVVRPGDIVEVQPPAGSFTPGSLTPGSLTPGSLTRGSLTRGSLRQGGHHALIAAGSGITPVLSIAWSLLLAGARVTLVYGNRRADTVMFADEVADLKDAFPTRMRLMHVLSREAQEVDLFSGRLDAAKLRVLLPATVDVPAVDDWWLCGPFGMVDGAIGVLTDLGVPRSRLHRELFYVEDTPPPPARHAEEAGPGAEVTVILDGRATSVTIPPGTPILDGAQRARADLPFACKAGVCGTCRARLVDGKVTMRRNFALEESELAVGYVLTCQSLPGTPTVTVDYDS
jgi:ring-1,2-phenylacetyl-CoA epoxidase subunit PaaE